MQVVVNARGARFVSGEIEVELATLIEGSVNDGSMDDGYWVEMALPWSCLGVVAANGVELGANIALSSRALPDDGSARGGRSLSRDWSGGTEAFRVPDAWGTFVLVGGGESASDAGMFDAGVGDAGQDAGEAMTPEGGCAVGHSDVPLPAILFALVALFWRRRRCYSRFA